MSSATVFPEFHQQALQLILILCWSSRLLSAASTAAIASSDSVVEYIVRVRTWTLVSNLPEHELQDVGRTFLYLRLQSSRSDFVSSTLAASPQPRLPLDRAVDSEEPSPSPELSGCLCGAVSQL